MSLAAQARIILTEWVKSDVLRKHCGAVAASMAYLAPRYAGDADVWEATGILHDMDYERHPSLEVAEHAHPPTWGCVGCVNTVGAKKFAVPYFRMLTTLG